MPVSHPPPHRFLVEPKKLERYLLDIEHPDGRSKAMFFIGWGFDPGRPLELLAALIHHPRTAPLVATSTDAWGIRFVYEGSLAAPNGRTPPLRTVWEVRTGGDVARLLTAYRF